MNSRAESFSPSAAGEEILFTCGVHVNFMRHARCPFVRLAVEAITIMAASMEKLQLGVGQFILLAERKRVSSGQRFKLFTAFAGQLTVNQRIGDSVDRGGGGAPSDGGRDAIALKIHSRSHEHQSLHLPLSSHRFHSKESTAQNQPDANSLR